METLGSEVGVEGQILPSSNYNYKLQKVLGEGAFGKVAHCIRTDTQESVAVKILKRSRNIMKEAEQEKKMLTKTNDLDPDQLNFVHFIEHFVHEDLVCLVFEKLDMSLESLINIRGFLNLKEIRQISQQLLIALETLNKTIIHSDIKPENIMLVDHKEQPFKVKIIDFGLAFLASKNRQGSTMQPLLYRSPEVILGLPITPAIDMWSLGCVLAYLFTGRHLFDNAHCEYDMLKLMNLWVGKPRKSLLDVGVKTGKFFKHGKGRWKLRKQIRFGRKQDPRLIEPIKTLDHLRDARCPSDWTKAEREPLEPDEQDFICLLKQMLHPNWDERISPSEALQLAYITNTYQQAVAATNDLTASEASGVNKPAVGPRRSEGHYPEYSDQWEEFQEMQ